jgi:mannose-6-phosphate isomerase
MICDGEGTLNWGEDAMSVKAGDCFLIPANLGEYALNGNMTVLRSYLP